MRQNKNAPAERPDERKVCGTQKIAEDRKDCMVEIDNSWKTNTFSHQIT